MRDLNRGIIRGVLNDLRKIRMKNWFKSAVICAVLATPCVGGNGKGPEVDLVDNKLSINADTVPLGRLTEASGSGDRHEIQGAARACKPEHQRAILRADFQ